MGKSWLGFNYVRPRIVCSAAPATPKSLALIVQQETLGGETWIVDNREHRHAHVRRYGLSSISAQTSTDRFWPNSEVRHRTASEQSLPRVELPYSTLLGHSLSVERLTQTGCGTSCECLFANAGLSL